MEKVVYHIQALGPADLRWWRFRRTARVMADLNALAAVVSSTPRMLTAKRVRQQLKLGPLTIFVAVEAAGGRLIGMASHVVSVQLLEGKAWLEDVAVLKEYLGAGIGKMLTIAVALYARQLGINKLDLTSKEERDAAHLLYEGLGWETRQSWLARLNPAAFDRAMARRDPRKYRLTRIALPKH